MDLWNFPHKQVLQETTRELSHILPSDEDESSCCSPFCESKKYYNSTTMVSSSPMSPRASFSRRMSVTSASLQRRPSLSASEINSTLHFISTRDSVELRHSWLIIQQLLDEVKCRDAEIQSLQEENKQLQQLLLEHGVSNKLIQSKMSQFHEPGQHCSSTTKELYHRLQEYAFPLSTKK